MTSDNFFPLANAYRTYGRYISPGPGVHPIDAPLSNHIIEVPPEADEIEYPVEGHTGCQSRCMNLKYRLTRLLPPRLPPLCNPLELTSLPARYERI